MQTQYIDLEKVFAIQNYGASGTTLMHSLFDDHPEVVSMPLLMARELYYVWEKICQQGISLESINRNIRANFPQMFDPLHPGNDPSLQELGEAKNQRLKVDEKTFFNYFEHVLPSTKKLTRKGFLLSVFLAYNFCFGRRFTAKATLCFPVHDLPKKYALWLAEDFKEVYFLHMIREPVKNLGSLMKHINHHQMVWSFHMGLLNCAFSQVALERSVHWGSREKSFGKMPYMPDYKEENKIISSRYVRLEDVHQAPDQTLTAICEWLEIKWDPILLKSTVMGLLWHNRKESIRVSGLNKQVVSQSHSEMLTGFDQYRLRLLTYPENSYFGYGQLTYIEKIIFCFLPVLCLLPFKVAFNSKRASYRISFLFGKAHIEEGCIRLRKKSGFFEGPLLKSWAMRVLLLCKLPFNYFQLRWFFLKKWSLTLFNPTGRGFIQKLDAQLANQVAISDKSNKTVKKASIQP